MNLQRWLAIDCYLARHDKVNLNSKGMNTLLQEHNNKNKHQRWVKRNITRLLGPEHTGHFVQPHVAAHCGGPEHTRATCMLCMQTLCLWRGRATACRTLEPQTAVCSPKLENNGFLREYISPPQCAATCGWTKWPVCSGP